MSACFEPFQCSVLNQAMSRKQVLRLIGMHDGDRLCLTSDATPQVFREHPEWIGSILELADNIVKSTACGQGGPMLDLINLICGATRGTAQALANLTVRPHGGPGPSMSQHPPDDDAAAEDLLQAMFRGVDAHRARLFVEGLKLALYAVGIKAALATLPVNPGSPLQEISLSQAEIEAMVFALAKRECAGEVRMNTTANSVELPLSCALC